MEYDCGVLRMLSTFEIKVEGECEMRFGTAALFAMITNGLLTPAMAFAQQDYPSRALRVVYPFLAGTGNEAIARVLAQRFAAVWGRPAVIDNRAGAGGTVGAENVLRSTPDGHVLLVSTASVAVNVTLFPKLPLRELQPISQVTSNGVVLVVHPSVPARNLAELLAIGRARKDGLTFGSSGVGTTSHLAGAWIQQLSKIKLAHVPYKGQNAALPALIGGEVELLFPGTGAIPSLIASKKVKGIAVTTRERSRVLPDLPTVSSIFPGFEVDNWVGIWAPPNTPPAIVSRIYGEVSRALEHQDMKPSLQFGDTKGIGSSPAVFSEYYNQEIEKYARIIRAAGIQQE